MRQLGIRAQWIKPYVQTTINSDFSNDLKNILDEKFNPEHPDAVRNATKNMINSYSKKAYPWDNACIESFHSLLKREWINRFKIFNFSHAYKLVFEYIETFYNTVRIHSHCDYLSPNEYEAKYLKELEEKQSAFAS